MLMIMEMEMEKVLEVLHCQVIGMKMEMEKVVAMAH